MKQRLGTMAKEVELFYDEISCTYDSFEHRTCDAILEHFLLANIPNKKLHILDAGGGIGRFSKPLLVRGHDVTLVDVSQGMVNKAKELLSEFKHIQFLKGSVTDLKFSAETFDIVIMMNAILDYCGNHNKAIQEAFRVLKKGELLIGNVNNRLTYCRNHELKEGDYKLFERNMKTGDRYITWGNKGKGHMSHEFTLSELKEVLLRGGFAVRKMLGVFNLLDKYEMENTKNKKAFIKLQIAYAKCDEYIHNSSDFFFVAEKPR